MENIADITKDKGVGVWKGTPHVTSVSIRCKNCGKPALF